MTSRLDRLFILLESGSSGVTRRAAAKQIGEVQKLYPNELHRLLNRLIGYLHSTSWDTRIAAAQAVDAILKNVPEWQPGPIKKHETQTKYLRDIGSASAVASAGITEDENICLSNDSSTTSNTTVSTSTVSELHPKDAYLTFIEFNLEQVLSRGALLFGSEGVEFDDLSEDKGGSIELEVNSVERLNRQRALLNEKLGLTQASKLGINLTDLITNEDVMQHHHPQTKPTASTPCSVHAEGEKLPVERILKLSASRTPNFLDGKSSNEKGNSKALSCREINRAKRKARQNAATIPVSSNLNGCAVVGDEPEGKKLKSTNMGSGRTASASGLTIGESGQMQPEIFYSLKGAVPDLTGNWVDAVNWPLESFCGCLYIDLFNPKWEIRHGAATALRELINQHGSGAGKHIQMTAEEMENSHNRWLEDAALRLICVLSLDRFGDFVSDQVIAPVRETCAQVLGTIVKEMTNDQVCEVVSLLRILMKQREWEVRHGGLLGLKYIFVVRQDLLTKYLSQTIDDIISGLFDAVDDVGAVAADTLIPVSNHLLKLLDATQVSSIVSILWDLLLDQDELASACNSFMSLLASILSLPDIFNWIKMESLSVLIPRLWPFLSNYSSLVRKSTLCTLKTLTNPHKKDNVNKQNKKSGEDNNTHDIKSEDMNTSHECGLQVHRNKHFSDDKKSCELIFGVNNWPKQLLQDALRHIYQRILVEPKSDIQQLAQDVWANLVNNADLTSLLHASCPYMSTWMCMAMQPAHLSFDPSVLIEAPIMDNSDNISAFPRTAKQKLQIIGDSSTQSMKSSSKFFLGGCESTPSEIREQNSIRARVMASKVLGLLSKYLLLEAPGVQYNKGERPIECYTKVLMSYLNSRSAMQRIVCGLTVAFWAQNDSSIYPGPKNLIEKLNSCLLENVYYDEVAVLLTRLLQDAYDLLLILKEYKIDVCDLDKTKVLTLAQIEELINNIASKVNLLKYNLKKDILEMIEERRDYLKGSMERTVSEQKAYNISTQAALAGALVSMRSLPTKLNPIVKPLMESIKCEDCQQLQQLSAEFLVHLMEQVYERQPSPNNKILNNLCTLLKSDTEFTPKITLRNTAPLTLTLAQTPEVCTMEESKDNPYYGIFSLHQHDNINSGSCPAVNTSIALVKMAPTSTTSHRGPGRPPLSETAGPRIIDQQKSNSAMSSGLCPNARDLLPIDLEKKYERIQRLGASLAITQLCRQLNVLLITKIPIFEELCFKRIQNYVELYPNMNELSDKIIEMDRCNELITSLQLIETTSTSLHPKFQELLFGLLNSLGVLIAHPFKAIRHLSARCLASLAEVDATRTMNFIVNNILQSLRCMENVILRQGAVETVEQIVGKLQIKIVPFIVMLIVPLLGCISDPNECIRLLATRCFASLIQLMPLDLKHSSSTSDVLKDEALIARKKRDFEFLEYLLTPNSIPNYTLPIALSVKLRTYQQAGVNWLWFLNKYNLHGILCDDMGLGKTLQTICIMAGDHSERRNNGETELTSLVICPPTLTGHWIYEIEKFLQNSGILRPLHYVGLPTNREQLRSLIGSPDCNVVVTSYDTIRKDIEFLSKINWNYCVLDEGHIIKNGKTKSSKAIKQLRANHRLILSGTPIQNNVLELWSLFDFLMPGFLGTEKEFAVRYSRPILASRDAKCSTKDQEAGVLAMEALHKQVLPFLLRRMKEDVLDDLPPKITQDLMCDLSLLQKRLYEDFSRQHLEKDDVMKQRFEQHLMATMNPGQKDFHHSKTHIFHALRYLQNVCNHPKLVLTARHPEYEKIRNELKQQNTTLDDIEHSAKLLVLKQLLLDCGIGLPLESVGQHRALIFCQLKSMLDIVEKDLLQKHLPSVCYLRLDGSVPASQRQDIVHNFNSDPSIDVLLLTTQVGGLGLSLTGADTVIFVEHDWNPMKDLQAMDRAHRIGQKKVVNVYRLITRQSLEEKIMGLQKFKMLTANTVVSNENASLETMATSELFDLFQDPQKKSKSEDKASVKNSSNSTTSHPLSMNSVIENLPELWLTEQYDEEYDVTNYLEMLKKA